MKFALNGGNKLYWKEIPNTYERQNFDKFVDILEYEDERANVRFVNHIAKNQTMELIIFVDYGHITGVHYFNFKNSDDYLYACNTIARWSND